MKRDEVKNEIDICHEGLDKFECISSVSSEDFAVLLKIIPRYFGGVSMPLPDERDRPEAMVTLTLTIESAIELVAGFKHAIKSCIYKMRNEACKMSREDSERLRTQLLATLDDFTYPSEDES